jgi:predicted RND superfamily exporter protein
MSRFDLRAWSLHHPSFVAVLFAALSAVCVWGNLQVEKGGILDRDVILREDDPFRMMDRYVHDKVRDGFEGREFISFVINSGVHSARDAEKILRVTRDAQAVFGETIASLATVPAYRDTGDTLLDEPYVTKHAVASSHFQIDVWRRDVAHDASVFGLLVGRDFSWASVVRYLPPGYDEIREFRRTVEFVEGRAIPWWEWLWKKDIHPTDAGLGVSGWTMGRGLIDQGINVDILSLVFLGVFLTLPIFWAMLGSGRAALLGVGVMVVGGFVWTRGAMGLLGVPERVFSLLAYASVIVQGTSFALHKFSAVEESDAEDRVQEWLHARAVDGLIATTAALSAFGFATLWVFGLKPIRELGIAATVGVACLLFLAVFVLPAFDLLTAPRAGRELQRRGTARRTPTSWLRLSTSLFEGLVARCVTTTTWLSSGYRPWSVVAGVCGLFAFVVVIFMHGAIPSCTRALEFIRGTLVEREARFLNQPGNVGFEFLDLLVEPRQGAGVDVEFLARAWEFQETLKTLPGGRETTSILGTLHRIAQESFKKPFPETPDEVAAAFFLIDNRLAPAVRRQLYFPGGVRISVSYGTDDSVELGRFRDALLSLAQRSFPDLQVHAFNKVPLYPQVDKYVREGKVSNVLVSQLGIAGMCGLLLWWRNRRLRDVRLSPLAGGLVMSLPLLFATAVMGLTMWCFRIPLDMATAPIGALAINAATDFSLYLSLTYQQALDAHSPTDALRGTVRREGKVILADCLLNICCFLPLISSNFLPVRQLGWMMGLMLLACAVGSLLFMAALLPWCVKRKELQYDPTSVPVHARVGRFLPFIPGARRAHGAGNHPTSAPAAYSSC